MKKRCRFFLLFAFVGLFAKSYSQSDTAKPVKVAVFIPLYVDDIFEGSEYTLGKSNLPKSVLPGLEFYNGVAMAIDSLNRERTFSEISIYDTKQTAKSLAQLLATPELSNVSLMIAAITNTTELKVFADQALQKKIPLISATYPNSIGIAQNPLFVLLNSSFPTHLDGLYRHMQRYYSTGTITAITRKGATETYIKNYITELNKNPHSPNLKIRWLNIEDEPATVPNLQTYLDSTKNNVFFIASPLESFGLRMVKTLNTYDHYHTTAIGMPTWDNIKDLDKPDCSNVDIVFSTPFLYYSQNQNLSSEVNRKYKDKYYSRPSDMVFKGFETVYHFTRLLVKYRDSLINNLSDKDFTLFNNFMLEPVKTKKTSPLPDFYENKKLYFIKKQQGNVKSII